MEDRKLDLVGVSDPFKELLNQASMMARFNRPVLLVGERGTGKKSVGELIHSLSSMETDTFAVVDCATFTDEHLASELFGHEAGAIDGANSRYLGILERTNGGTVFLNEIDKVSLHLQKKLQQVLKQGQFQRIGSFNAIHTNVRIISATTKDLPSLCEEGNFQQDLLDHLAFDVLTLPPLQARREDIELLANHFAIQMTRELGRESFIGFSPSVLKKLISHSWHGNVAELRKVIERAVCYLENENAKIELIKIDPFKSCYRPVIIKEEPRDKEIPQGPIDLKDVVSDYEKNIILDTLDRNRGNQTAAASDLGLTYNQFRGILRKYSIKF